MSDPQAPLREMKPEHEFFVGIDSDGCAFDTMEPKHKECFCPSFIWKFGLAAVSKYAREAWDFVNLYSKTRGCNRFLAVQHVMNFLRERDEVKRRGVKIRELPELKAWTERETKLGNPALEEEVKRTGNEELKLLLDWSTTVNATVAKIVKDVPPYPWVRESLKVGDTSVSPTFCLCSAGFHKKRWDVIFEQPLDAEIVETVLEGDPWCKIAIHLPEEALAGAKS